MSKTGGVQQDWKPQVFNFQSNSGGAGGSKKLSVGEANKALRTGGAEIVKKEHATGNQHNAGPGARAKVLDEDHESTKVKTVSHEVKVNIMRGRQAKGWTQTDLAREISEKASVITEYENGKAIPNEQVLIRIEKALGMHLRGVKAGQPMDQKKKKGPK